MRRAVEALCREGALAVDGFADSCADCLGPRPSLSTLDTFSNQLSAFVALLDGFPRERHLVSSLAIRIGCVRTALQRAS